MIVRDDKTKNGAWAWARLRERFGRHRRDKFTEVFQYSWPSEKPFEDVCRDWVKKVSKVPQSSLSSQAIEQLTISLLARHGQPELENHLRLRAPMAWQDIQTQVEKYLSTIYHQQSRHHNRRTLAMQRQIRSARVAEARLINEVSVGTETRHAKTCCKQGHLTKMCRRGNTHKQSSISSKGTGKGTGKDSGKGKGRNKSRTRDTCVCCGKRRHMTSDCKFKYTASSNCGKLVT